MNIQNLTLHELFAAKKQIENRIEVLFEANLIGSIALEVPENHIINESTVELLERNGCALVVEGNEVELIVPKNIQAAVLEEINGKLFEENDKD